MNLLEFTDKLLRKFKININQIIRCSDNTLEDIRNEAFIVVFDNLSSVEENERVFINKLKSNCLKFNKYGRRIESKDRFEKFNEYENKLVEEENNSLDLDEEKLCTLLDIQNLISKKDYEFLIDYYSLGCELTSVKYNINKDLTRKRVSNLIKEIRSKL